MVSQRFLRNLEFLDSKKIGQKYRGFAMSRPKGVIYPRKWSNVPLPREHFKGTESSCNHKFSGYMVLFRAGKNPLRLAICCKRRGIGRGYGGLNSNDCWHHFYAGSFPSHPLNPWEPHNLQPSGVIAYSLSPTSLGLKTLIVPWFWVPKVVGVWTSHLKTVALGWWYA